jgi:hypothetical protein
MEGKKQEPNTTGHEAEDEEIGTTHARSEVKARKLAEQVVSQRKETC